MSDAVDLMLGVFRSPARSMVLRARELPDGILDVIRIAADDATAIAAASASTGLDNDDLHLAAGLLLHNLCFFDGADAYRTLGVQPQDDAVQIKLHYRWLVRWLHPDRGPENLHGVFADRVNHAWNAIRTPERRARYDQSLHATGDAGAASVFLVDTSALLRAWSEPAPGALFSARAVQRLPRLVAAGAGTIALATLALGAWMASRSMEAASPELPVHSASTAQAVSGLEHALVSVAATPAPVTAFRPPAVAAPPQPVAPQLQVPPLDQAQLEASQREVPLITAAAPARHTVAAGTPKPVAAPKPAGLSHATAVLPRHRRTAAPSLESAAIPQPATVPVATAAVLSSSELREFIQRFEHLYTADDVDQFLTLFSADARGNKGNYADLAGDYRRLFEQRRQRRLVLSDLRWEIDGNRAAGNGSYAAWVGPGAGKPESHTRGRILLQLTRDGLGLRITRLHHTVEQ